MSLKFALQNSHYFGDFYKSLNSFIINMELTLIVANGYQDKSIIFNSEIFNLKGVGKSKERAMIEATRSLRADDTRLQMFIQESRQAITRYFAINCESIIGEAQLISRQATLATKSASITENQFVRAVGLLNNIRNANYLCYQSELKKINQVLEDYIQFACKLNLGRAKDYWAAHQIEQTVFYLNKIPSLQKCQSEVNDLLRQVDNYLKSNPNQDLKDKIQALTEREKTSKNLFEIILESQKN